MDNVELSIIIVNWNTRKLLAQCLASIYAHPPAGTFEIFVVDNASGDGSAQMVLSEFPQVYLIENAENIGFARANNQALARCQGRYALLLNSDAQLLPGSLDKVVRFMDRHPRAGIAGVRLLNSDGTFQASYTPFPTLWSEILILSTLGRRLIRATFPSYGPQVEEGAHKIRGYVEGAFLMTRGQALEQIGGLDEHIFMYAEEVDWCYRFHQAGWEVWYLPQAPIIHHGGQSSKKRRSRMEAELYRSRIYFFRKHYGKVLAFALKILIFGITLPKILFHSALRRVTGERCGRPTTNWQELRLALIGTEAPSQETAL